MKRSTANWTTAIAASALLAMPVGSWAQQASPTPSQTSRPAGAQADQKGSANEHLRQAEAALNDIPAASLTGTAKTKVAELKRHIATLNKSAGKSASAPAGKANWSTDVAAADRILTDLLGAGSTTGATGTSGATAAKPADKTAPITLDETAKSKLQDVRTHLTAFAASMSGASSAPAASTPSADDPSSSASASAAAATAPSASASTTASPSSPASASPSSPSAAPASPSSPATPAATPSEPSASASATPSAQAQSAQPAQSVDTDNVKRHLTAARDSLSQLTQLPAAAQLTGDSRTQVSQLISNFNELITTKTEWRASYGKLQANLNALVGEKGEAAPAAPTAPGTGTPGAVGTSGTTGLDPAIRAKLEEFRAHLSEFEKAAGGAVPTASAAASTPAESATPAARTPDSSAAAAPAASPSSPATASPATTSPSEPSPAAPTASTTSPSAASSTSPAASATPQSASPAAQSTDAMRHIEAIEAILNGGSASSSGPTGTSGSTAAKAKTTSSPSSLDREQIEKIREHLSDLRKSLNK